MTEDDLSRIEKSLAIKLPTEYRRIVLNYPLRFNEGKDKDVLWDNADRLIEENLRYRAHRSWPKSIYFVGEDGGGWQFAIDLTETLPHVLHVEFGDVDTAHPHEGFGEQPKGPKRISDWFHEYLLELSEEVDINSANPNATSWKECGCVLIACATVAVLIVLVSLGIASLRI